MFSITRQTNTTTAIIGIGVRNTFQMAPSSWNRHSKQATCSRQRAIEVGTCLPLRLRPCKIPTFRPRKRRGPKDHINTRILHSGSRAQYDGYNGNHALRDPDVDVVFWGVLAHGPHLSCDRLPGEFTSGQASAGAPRFGCFPPARRQSNT